MLIGEMFKVSKVSENVLCGYKTANKNYHYVQIKNKYFFVEKGIIL